MAERKGEFKSQDFIQDFLNEAGDHIRNLKRNLLALENTFTSEAGMDVVVERISILEELFRSFHTLKGLSGMVGLEQAVEISHACESILREMQQARLDISASSIDDLLDGVRVLDGLVDHLKDAEAPEPDTAGVLKQLNLRVEMASPASGGVTASPAASGQPAEASMPLPQGLPAEFGKFINLPEQQRIQAAFQRGDTLSVFVFAPDEAKSATGLNVNRVREELLTVGEIIKGAPLIDGASVRFAFLVASHAPVDAQLFPYLEMMPLAQPALPQRSREPDSPTGVRVELERLDELMRLVGDLLVSHSRLEEALPLLSGPASALDSARQSLARMSRELRDLRQATLRSRMVPLRDVFNHMPLAVRDLSRAYQKNVHLEMQGEDTEIDRVLAERLLDPLLHLVRNAIIHGIEPPEERLKGGKPAHGALTLTGKPEGDHILVLVSDDGRGIDIQAVSDAAVSKGLLEPGKLLPEADLLEFLCRPGFSTRKQADMGAGRGVGLDVVNRMVKSVGGSLSLRSTPGQGSTFIISMPFTLTILRALLVGCASQRYAVPQNFIREVIEIDPTQITRVEGGEMLPYHEASIAILRLARLFHLDRINGNSAISQPGLENQSEKPARYGLVIDLGSRQFLLAVDSVLSIRDVVVRTFSDPLAARPGILGATELGDGSVILIIDTAALYQFSWNDV